MNPFSIDQGVPFELFGTSHIVSLVIIVGVWIGLPLLGRRLDDGAKRRTEIILVVVMIVQHLSWFVWRIVNGAFDIHKHLPIELCSFTNIIAVIAFVSRKEFFASWVWYWALAGAMQAVITPDTRFGFPHYEYIQTMVHHALLILAAIWFAVVRGFRPTWKTFWQMTALTATYTALVLGYNALTGSNYMFLNALPTFDTFASILASVFGPWPLYLIGYVVVAIVSFVLITAPFEIAKAVRKKRSA